MESINNNLFNIFLLNTCHYVPLIYFQLFFRLLVRFFRFQSWSKTVNGTFLRSIISLEIFFSTSRVILIIATCKLEQFIWFFLTSFYLKRSGTLLGVIPGVTHCPAVIAVLQQARPTCLVSSTLECENRLCAYTVRWLGRHGITSDRVVP